MYIVADIGGTNTRIAGSRDLSAFGEPAVSDTPQDYQEALTLFSETAKKLAGGDIIATVIVGVKGVLSSDARMLLTAPQNMLRDWKDRALASDLESLLHASVVLENDTALVGLGEATHGAGQGADVVAYITVSTGVNGARVVGGLLDKGHPEIGGQYLQVGDAMKSLEELVSGVAVAEKYGVHPREIDKDSPVWEELARITAFGVHNAILHWSPDRVVLGGSMFNEVGISVDRVRAHVEDIMRKFPTTPEIVHSNLGDLGGLWGGLARLKQISPAH